MKKICILIFFIPLFLISCRGNVETPQVSDDEIAEIEKRQQGDSSKEETLRKVDEYVDDFEAITEYMNRFSKITKYEKESTGVTETIVNQDIYAKVTRDGNTYTFYNTTNSALVDQYHEANFDSTGVSFRNKNTDEFTSSTLADYKKEYGVTPYDNTLFDYVINADTVSKIEREKVENNYKFTVTLNIPSDATKYISIQMKKLGELSEVPEFKSAVLTITIDENFNPISGNITAEYKVPYGWFNIDCTQKLDVTFKLGEI